MHIQISTGRTGRAVVGLLLLGLLCIGGKTAVAQETVPTRSGEPLPSMTLPTSNGRGIVVENDTPTGGMCRECGGRMGTTSRAAPWALQAGSA
jgi:hypothetical protein